MKLYIAMIADRHSDPEPYPFTTPEAAIAFARREAEQLTNTEVVEEPVAGWLYHATYSGEGDSVWVVERELDAPQS